MTFSKKDLFSSIVTGLTTGIIAWRILTFLRPGLFDQPIFGAGFIVGIPILWILGVNLGYFLGQWFGFFNQFGKFVVIGFTNAAVDFGILNLLIGLTGTASGLQYSLFKTTSFIVAVVHSYSWNKYWTFESTSANKAQGEFAKFIVVNVIVATLNIGVASIVVNQIHPVFGLNANTWANVGAVVGSAVALIFNFVGFRFIVFRKNRN